MTLLQLGKAFMPPIVAAALRPIRDVIWRPSFEYVGDIWPEHVEGSSWSSDPAAASLATEAAIFRVMLARPTPLGMTDPTVASEPVDLILHNTLISAATVFLRTGLNKKCLSVLDWGGGAGAYYALAKALLPGIHLQFTVVDFEPFCRRGREVFPEVRFLEHFDDDGITYDLVIASSSLQYARDWRQTLDILTGRAAEALFLHRVPVVLQGSSFVVKQRVPTWRRRFLGWHFSRQELLDAAQGHEFALAREFLVAERPVVWKAPVQPEYRGFLFDRLQH